MTRWAYLNYTKTQVPWPTMEVSTKIESNRIKIKSFGFKTISYQIDSQDIQEGPILSSMIILVSGTLSMECLPKWYWRILFS